MVFLVDGEIQILLIKRNVTWVLSIGQKDCQPADYEIDSFIATLFDAENPPFNVSIWSLRCLLSSWIHSSIPLRPIPKSLRVVRVNRRSCRQRSPLLIPKPVE